MKQITFFFAVIVIVLLSCPEVHPQIIKLYFPHFSDHNYEWKIIQGQDSVTVSLGKIPEDGRVTLIMPETYQHYRGMTRWMLKKGGGLDMIFTGKDFSVECLSPQPSKDNIIYKNNPDNNYLSAQGQHQHEILNKLGAVNHLLQAYSPDDSIHKIGLKEQNSLHLQFEQIQAERSNSALYAARFGEIVDFTRGVANKIYANQADHKQYFNDFVTDSLNFEDLYTSGHWQQVIHNWLMMNIQSEDGEEAFIKRLSVILKRMNQDLILGAFAQTAVPFSVQKGKDGLLPVIQTHLNQHPEAIMNVSDKTRQMLSSFQIMIGQKAPDLIFKAPVLTQKGKIDTDIVLKTAILNSDYTIILFYSGSCQLCEDALITLANRYKWLNKRNIRVIAVSGDETEEGFKKKQAYHQWQDNYCDFRGIEGVNFSNYAVMVPPPFTYWIKKVLF